MGVASIGNWGRPTLIILELWQRCNTKWVISDKDVERTPHNITMIGNVNISLFKQIKNQ